MMTMHHDDLNHRSYHIWTTMTYYFCDVKRHWNHSRRHDKKNCWSQHFQITPSHDLLQMSYLTYINAPPCHPARRHALIGCEKSFKFKKTQCVKVRVNVTLTDHPVAKCIPRLCTRELMCVNWFVFVELVMYILAIGQRWRLCNF